MPLPVAIVSTANDLTDWLIVIAALIQAVGSVAAIAAAVLLTRHDRKEGVRMATQQRISALAVIMSRAEDTIRPPYVEVSARGGAAYSEFFGDRAFAKSIRALSQCQRILASVPVYELGDWELASAVIDMEEALVTGKAALEQIKASNLGAILYPDMANIDLTALVAPVNLAAGAMARVHQAAHRYSSSKMARKSRITPNLVN